MGFNSGFKGLKILSLLDVDKLHSQQITKGHFRLFGSVETTTSQVTLHGPKLIFCLVLRSSGVCRRIAGQSVQQVLKGDSVFIFKDQECPNVFFFATNLSDSLKCGEILE